MERTSALSFPARQSDTAEDDDDPAIDSNSEIWEALEAQMEVMDDVLKQLTSLWDTVESMKVSTQELMDKLL